MLPEKIKSYRSLGDYKGVLPKIMSVQRHDFAYILLIYDNCSLFCDLDVEEYSSAMHKYTFKNPMMLHGAIKWNGLGFKDLTKDAIKELFPIDWVKKDLMRILRVMYNSDQKGSILYKKLTDLIHGAPTHPNSIIHLELTSSEKEELNEIRWYGDIAYE